MYLRCRGHDVSPMLLNLIKTYLSMIAWTILLAKSCNKVHLLFEEFSYQNFGVWGLSNEIAFNVVEWTFGNILRPLMIYFLAQYLIQYIICRQIWLAACSMLSCLDFTFPTITITFALAIQYRSSLHSCQPAVSDPVLH